MSQDLEKQLKIAEAECTRLRALLADEKEKEAKQVFEKLTVLKNEILNKIETYNELAAEQGIELVYMGESKPTDWYSSSESCESWNSSGMNC